MSDHIVFMTMNADGSTTDALRIPRQVILACDHVILDPEHYREDGTCRCDDEDHEIMDAWGYRWNGEKWMDPAEV